MAQDEGREQAGLGSAEDLRLERLLEDLAATTTTFALSLRAFRRQPENLVYRASVDQQGKLGRDQIRKLLAIDAVAYSPEAATEAVRGIEAFLALSQQFRSEDGLDLLRELFREVVTVLFGEAHLARHGPPHASLSELLGRWVDLPVPAPAVVAPTVSVEGPRVLFEQAFSHGDPGTARPSLGPMLLAVFEHVRGLSPAEAKSRLNAHSLIGFDQSIQTALGDYRGPVTFRILQEGDETPKIELRRIALRPPP